MWSMASFLYENMNTKYKSYNKPKTTVMIRFLCDCFVLVGPLYQVSYSFLFSLSVNTLP